MNELRAIVEAFDAATAKRERCALATVVSVDGSSYRRPGARMLIGEGGGSTGTISAGCLEADVIEHARRVIDTASPQLLEYDTTSANEDIVWGLGLGCNGVVRVLVEPVDGDSIPIAALRRSSGPGPRSEPVLLATVYRRDRAGWGVAADVHIGAHLTIAPDHTVAHDGMSPAVAAALTPVLQFPTTSPVASGSRVHDVEGTVVTAFVERLLPPVRLVIFGAGQDAVPVMESAHALGWQVEVADPRCRPASLDRFAKAAVRLTRAEDFPAVAIDAQTAALVMSHDYAQDLAALARLVGSPASYIGVMGPRKRTVQMLGDLATRGLVSDEDETLARLHAPAGLDIGANGPAEIALSIVAEARAVLAGRQGGLLRDRAGAIHARAADGSGRSKAAERPLHVTAVSA
jgi:xanthine/CO dehydrogenase XdhC/CoxF family maturation factor